MSVQSRSLKVRPDIKSKWQACRAVVNSVTAARILWKLRWSDIERGLFGGDFKRAYDKYRTMGMWRHVHGGSMERAVIELGKTLGAITTGEYNWLLHGLDESADPEQAKVDSAVKTGGLVLVEASRSAYWNCQSIEVAWYRYSKRWDYLWLLAEHGHLGKVIGRWDFGDSDDVAFLIKKKNRLKGTKGFPAALIEKIKSPETGTQTLDLPQNLIWLIRSE